MIKDIVMSEIELEYYEIYDGIHKYGTPPKLERVMHFVGRALNKYENKLKEEEVQR